jgi:hypothetical protein
MADMEKAVRGLAVEMILMAWTRTFALRVRVRSTFAIIIFPLYGTQVNSTETPPGMIICSPGYAAQVVPLCSTPSTTEVFKKYLPTRISTLDWVFPASAAAARSVLSVAASVPAAASLPRE